MTFCDVCGNAIPPIGHHVCYRVPDTEWQRLRAEVERLRTKVEWLREIADHAETAKVRACEARNEALGERDELRAALEWYATDVNYVGYEDCDVMVDRGRIASAALGHPTDKPQYHLTCQQCGKPFWSDWAFTTRCISCMVGDTK